MEGGLLIWTYIRWHWKGYWYLLSPVKFHPPVNVTVQNGSDSNLWFYWNQSLTRCVESEVCYKINDKECKVSAVCLFHLFFRPFYALILISFSSLIKSVLESRTTASTCPPANLDMSWRCGAKWVNPVGGLTSGVTGVSRQSGALTTAQVKWSNI